MRDHVQGIDGLITHSVQGVCTQYPEIYPSKVGRGITMISVSQKEELVTQTESNKLEREAQRSKVAYSLYLSRDSVQWSRAAALTYRV